MENIKGGYPSTIMPFPLKIIDRYIPVKIAFHIKVVLFAVVVELFFVAVVHRNSIFSERVLSDIINISIMLEFFMWYAYKLFIQGLNPGSANRELTPGEITKFIVIRYTTYYVACMITATIEFVLFLYARYWIHGWDLSHVMHDFIYLEFLGWFKAMNVGFTIGAFLFIIIIWQIALKQAQKLKEEKMVFQYETLKNQVNPHFLFNSLNTLSSLVSSNTALAELFIQKLSAIYRYVLEYREVELVDLQTELNFVNDYFYLQQIRDDDKISLTIEEMKMEHYKILPISLQLLVDNALKHNSATRERPLNIVISKQEDTLVVKNNLQKKLSIEPSSQIGLKNVGERVKFITKKELQVTETANEFIVAVTLMVVER
jgi:two-component system, LytTR family, sensor kinase